MNLKSICNECTRFLFVDLNFDRIEIEIEIFQSIETIYQFGRENADGKHIESTWKEYGKNVQSKVERIWTEKREKISRTKNNKVSTVKYTFFQYSVF